MDYWTWLHELNDFQEYRITLPKPLTKDERIQVAQFRSLRHRIHDGPFYTVLGDNVRVGKAGEKGKNIAAHFDPFEGMPTYSQRYTRKKRRIPKLDHRPYGTIIRLCLSFSSTSNSRTLQSSSSSPKSSGQPSTPPNQPPTESKAAANPRSCKYPQGKFPTALPPTIANYRASQEIHFFDWRMGTMMTTRPIKPWKTNLLPRKRMSITTMQARKTRWVGTIMPSSTLTTGGMMQAKTMMRGSRTVMYIEMI